MIGFDWSSAQPVLQDFGGKKETLYVPKTGLPFFDALCLYGAIDLYIGLREDVTIKDKGNEWLVTGHARQNHISKKDERAFNLIWKNKKPKAEDYCKSLNSYLKEKQPIKHDEFVTAEKEFVGFDAVLQTGIRGISAYRYETLQTGQTSKAECKARLPLSQGILAFAGKQRCETLGRILFLPIFDGRIDFSKVISPLRFWIGPPNVLCAQALMLLALKSSLFAEGYSDRLSAVVYNTDFDSRTNFNCSGLISIQSTVLGKGKIASTKLVVDIYRVFKRIIENAWRKDRKPNSPTPEDALAIAYWLMQPVGKHLASMITSQERLKSNGYQHIFIEKEHVKEVFSMSYGNWNGDHEAVWRFAKAVASGIYNARQKKVDKKERGKAWYEEICILRSASSPSSFINRALTLIEQGHKENINVGTSHVDEDYDPAKLLDSIGSDFETFRGLFRMYLVQESKYRLKEMDLDSDDSENLEKEEE